MDKQKYKRMESSDFDVSELDICVLDKSHDELGLELSLLSRVKFFDKDNVGKSIVVISAVEIANRAILKSIKG